jgi:hypothetical protein
MPQGLTPGIYVEKKVKNKKKDKGRPPKSPYGLKEKKACQKT